MGSALSALASSRTYRLLRAGAGLCAIPALQLVAFSCYPIAHLIARPLLESARTIAAKVPRDGYVAILLLGGVGTPPAAGSAKTFSFISLFRGGVALRRPPAPLDTLN